MFSRPERLPRADFPTALRAKKRLSSANFLIIVPEGVRGYAVVIPKKVVRLSAARHRLKRQILEVLRALPLPASLVVFPRSGASSVNYEDMQAELKTLLSKIN